MIMSSSKRAKNMVRGQGPTSPPISGAAMDMAIKPKIPYGLWLKWGGLVSIFVVAIFILIKEFSSVKTYRIEQNRIKVATVEQATFEDFVILRGRVVPKTTVYLDAMASGRVEQILEEDGAIVQQGDLIAVLSSPNLLLSVNGNQAEVIGHLNNIREMELNLEKSLLMHKRDLVEVDYSIKKIEKKLNRQKKLLTKQVIAKMELSETEDELFYLKQRREIIMESQVIEARIQKQQLLFSQENVKQLEDNLKIANKNLDSLNIRAPVSGKLSGFNIEIGQSISVGSRLGQVDSMEKYKVTEEVDEFYLGRVDLGYKAIYLSNNNKYLLEVSKIYPQVDKGRFKIDLRFINDLQPEDIRRGQSIKAKLTLSDPTQALMMPNGAFYRDTGGHWIFVLNTDGTQAIKRKIKTGRRNINAIEILDGLNKGEKVIISSYKNFIDKQQLIIKSAQL